MYVGLISRSVVGGAAIVCLQTACILTNVVSTELCVMESGGWGWAAPSLTVAGYR